MPPDPRRSNTALSIAENAPVPDILNGKGSNLDAGNIGGLFPSGVERYFISTSS